MTIIFNNPLFGIALTIGTYLIAKLLFNNYPLPILNPLLVTIAFLILLLQFLPIPLSSYQNGASIINMFLAPATTVLAYSIYQQIALLKKHFIPIVCGCLVGSITSMLSAYFLCTLFGIEDIIRSSVLPKSVTTAIAIEISEQLGGIPSITVAVVVVTGILGSVLCPILIKLTRLTNKIAIGVGIGTCSHAVGTSKAIELGEVEGAMSGIAIGVAGILTVLLALFL